MFGEPESECGRELRSRYTNRRLLGGSDLPKCSGCGMFVTLCVLDDVSMMGLDRPGSQWGNNRGICTCLIKYALSCSAMYYIVCRAVGDIV